MPGSGFSPTFQGTRPGTDLITLKVAAGLHFTTPHNVSIGTATNATVLITTPATGTYHLRGQVQGDKALTWALSKAPNASGGSALTSNNNNQNSTTTGGLTITHTATYVSAGTVLVNGLVGADTGPVSLCADDGDGKVDWVLDQSTLYLVRCVAGAAGTNVIITLRHWAES